MHDMAKPVCLKRLLDKIIRALLNSRDSGFDRAVTANDNNRQIRVLTPQYIQELNAV